MKSEFRRFLNVSLLLANESRKTAITPRMIAKPNLRFTICPRIIASKIAACRTSVFENAVPAAKDLCEKRVISKTVKTI